MGRTPFLCALAGLVLTCGAAPAAAQLKQPVGTAIGVHPLAHISIPTTSPSASAQQQLQGAGGGSGYWEWWAYGWSSSGVGFGNGLGGGYGPGYSIYRPYNGYPYGYNGYPTYGRPATEPRQRGRATRTRPTRSTTAEKARAAKFVAAGDAHLTEGKFLAAVERYRAASRVAPELAEPHFRQGLALVAQGNYAGATRAFRRALELYIDGVDPPPASLEAICGARLLAQTNERISEGLRKNASNPDLLVAKGMQLFFSGQPDRAEVYLTQAARLGTLDGDRVGELLNGANPNGNDPNADLPADAPPDAAAGVPAATDAPGAKVPTYNNSDDANGFIKARL